MLSKINQKFFLIIFLISLSDSYEIYKETITDLQIQEVADAIRAGNFAEANCKSFEVHLSKRAELIDEAVKKLCADNSKSDDLILKYASETENTFNGFWVLSSFFREAKRPLEMETLIEIYEIGYKKLLCTFEEQIKDQLVDLQESIKHELSDRAWTIIYDDAESANLAMKLSSLKDFDFDDVLRENVRTTHVDLDTMREVWKHFQHIPQISSALSEINRKLNVNGFYFNSEVMQLAFYLSSLQRSSQYEHFSKARKSQVESVIQGLPKEVRNLYFGGRICVRNTDYNEYLYRGQSGSRVLESPHLQKGAGWFARNVGEHIFRFENQWNKNECMFAGEDNADKLSIKWENFGFWITDTIAPLENHRLVVTGIPGTTSDNRFDWRLEWHGDGFSITNVQFNELLCVSGLTEDEQRIVFTIAQRHASDMCTFSLISC